MLTMKNKKTHWWAYAVLGIILLSSCGTVTKFTSQSVQIGMSKYVVLDHFGTPYKTEIYKDGDDTVETYYYKESVFSRNSGGPVTITNILNFTNDKLESLQQGEEIDPQKFNTTTIIKEKEKD